ncbi:unnamed protein product [Caretta caretta]
MKRPLSLPHSAENRTHLAETAGSQSEQRTKREKKHQSFTLCEVCNIQLNSPAQAQIHYNGKSHQKRLKQLNKGKVPTGQENMEYPPGTQGHVSTGYFCYQQFAVVQNCILTNCQFAT